MATPYDTFETTWSGRPPAMPEGDATVWDKFKQFLIDHWTTVAYDVELRDGPYPIVSDDPTMQAMWMKLTARRIDALAWRSNIATIIEVRHAAAWQSYGQLMGYLKLWPLNYPNIPVEGAWLVTDDIPDDIRSVAVSTGLYVWTPDKFSPPTVPLVALPPGTDIRSVPTRAA